MARRLKFGVKRMVGAISKRRARGTRGREVPFAEAGDGADVHGLGVFAREISRSHAAPGSVYENIGGGKMPPSAGVDAPAESRSAMR